jgi:hypothetical protein
VTYLSHGQVLPIWTEADAGSRLDLLLHSPSSVAGRVCPLVDGGGCQRRRTEAGIAQGSGGAIAALVLRGRRGPAIYGRGSIDGVGGRPRAVEALRYVVVVLYRRNDSSRTGCVRKGAPRGEAVEGIGGARGAAHNLAKCQADVGAAWLDWRAQWRVPEKWRWRWVELDARPQSRAHHPRVIWRKRHVFIQDCRGRGLRKLSNISAPHGKCERLPVKVTVMMECGRLVRGSPGTQRSAAVRPLYKHTRHAVGQCRRDCRWGEGEGETVSAASERASEHACALRLFPHHAGGDLQHEPQYEASHSDALA